jgi:hypothetical protein
MTGERKKIKEKIIINDNSTTIHCHASYHEKEDTVELQKTDKNSCLGTGLYRMSHPNSVDVTHLLTHNKHATTTCLNKKNKKSQYKKY